ncbi:MAG: Spy/CpxP family protein refolding chaperone [bacterium]
MKSRKTLFFIICFMLILSSGACRTKCGKHTLACATPGKTCCKQGSGKCCGKGDIVACGNLPSPCGLLAQKDILGLNDSQVTKLKKLKSDSQKAKVRQTADLKILKIELQDLLDKKSVDKKAVEAKLDAIGTKRTKLAKDCINAKLTARELLSEEQLQKWKALKKSCTRIIRES